MRKKICILNTGGTILARGCENSCEKDDKNGTKDTFIKIKIKHYI